MWSYRSKIEDLCSTIPFSKCKGYFSITNTPYEFYSIAEKRKRIEEEEEGGLLRWGDFLKGISYLDEANVYFPTLTKETKRNGLFSRKEWMSYFVMAR